MIDFEKLKIVLDLYKKGYIDYDKAFTLLDDKQTRVYPMALGENWTGPYIFQPSCDPSKMHPLSNISGKS